MAIASKAAGRISGPLVGRGHLREFSNSFLRSPSSLPCLVENLKMDAKTIRAVVAFHSFVLWDQQQVQPGEIEDHFWVEERIKSIKMALGTIWKFFSGSRGSPAKEGPESPLVKATPSFPPFYYIKSFPFSVLLHPRAAGLL